MDDSWPVWVLVDYLVRKKFPPVEYVRVDPEECVVHYADFLAWDEWHERHRNQRLIIEVLARYNTVLTLWRSNVLNHHPMCPSCAYRTLLKDVGAHHG